MLTTRWAYEYFVNNPQWWEVEGQQEEFDEVDLDWGYAPNTYQIEVSNDDENWTVIANRDLVPHQIGTPNRDAEAG